MEKEFISIAMDTCREAETEFQNLCMHDSHYCMKNSLFLKWFLKNKFKIFVKRCFLLTGKLWIFLPEKFSTKYYLTFITKRKFKFYSALKSIFFAVNWIAFSEVFLHASRCNNNTAFFQIYNLKHILLHFVCLFVRFFFLKREQTIWAQDPIIFSATKSQ